RSASAFRFEHGDAEGRQGEFDAAWLIVPRLAKGRATRSVGDATSAIQRSIGIEDLSVKARYRDTHAVGSWKPVGVFELPLRSVEAPGPQAIRRKELSFTRKDPLKEAVA